MDTPKHHDGILIIDFGSPVHPADRAAGARGARLLRDPPAAPARVEWIREWRPKGIILSGGPNSVYDAGAPTRRAALLDLGMPVLGLCYGMQMLAQLAGGKVVRADRREYGRAVVTVTGGRLFRGFGAGEETAGLDEPRRPRGHAAARVRAHRLEPQLPGGRRSSTPRKPIYARAVPSRGGAHARGAARSSAPSCSTSAAATPDWTAGHFIETETARIRELAGPTRG